MTRVKQISVFLENKSGRLAEVTRTLADHQINIRALSIAETIDYGVLRLIVNDPAQAKQALADGGFTVTETEVIVVEIPDRPGGLANAIERLAAKGLNVEYAYAFVTHSGESANVVFRLEQIEEAARILADAGIRVLSGDEVYRL
jgi:hypothetical protein